MFFKAILMAMMSLSMISPVWSDTTNNDDGLIIPGPRFSRIVVLAQSHAGGGSGIPLDPNHQMAISSGMYTAAEALKITVEGLADFANKYGIVLDINTTDPDTGEIFLPLATGGAVVAFPGLSNLTDRSNLIVIDTANPDRANSHL